MIGKAVSKLIALAVIITAVLFFRETILTDKNAGTIFGALMSAIPFAKLITDKVCTVMKYQYSVPIVSCDSVIFDLLKLAVMALIQGPVTAGLMRIFLPLPNSGQEEYMKSAGYSIKSVIFKLITTPLIAVLSAWLSNWIFQAVRDCVGNILPILLGTAAVTGIAVLSALWLVKAGLSFGQALLWRFGISMGGKMVFTFLSNTVCLVLYISLTGGMSTSFLVAVIALAGVIIVEDIAIGLMRRAIIG